MNRLLEIGESLVAARRAAGVTQSDLGKRLGVTQPQVARWERSSYRSASLSNVMAVADALGVDLSATPMLAAESPASVAYGASSDVVTERLGVVPQTIHAFCRNHGISELAVFGSVARGDYDSASDVDLLVTWKDGRKPSSFAALDDLQSELAGIFRRRVDLLDKAMVERSENYIRRAAILHEARVLYVEG